MLYPSHSHSSLRRIINGRELSPLIGITSILGSHTPGRCPAGAGFASSPSDV